MKALAAVLTSTEERLSVEEVELEDPTAGRCVVEMAYGGVNPVDRYEAIGAVRGDDPLPRVLGSEGAGTVSEDGRQVEVFVARAALSEATGGTWATRLVAKREALVELPAGVRLEAAAAMGVAGVTAWRCATEVAGLKPDDRVLVLGATGGVGSILVSIAHRLGAEVVAQTGSQEKTGFTRARGADRTVVADGQSLTDELGDFSPTVVFDPLGGAFTGAAVEALAPRGRLVLFGTSADPVGELPLRQLYRKATRILSYAGLIEDPSRLRQGVRDGLQALAEDHMEVAIGEVLPLSEVNTALSNLADRKVSGNQLLKLRDDSV